MRAAAAAAAAKEPPPQVAPDPSWLEGVDMTINRLRAARLESLMKTNTGGASQFRAAPGAQFPLSGGQIIESDFIRKPGLRRH